MSSKAPICPGDPDDYVLVRSREGYFWRRKRKDKRSYFNKSISNSMQLMGLISPIAAEINCSLRSLMGEFYTGRLNNRISSALRKSIKETGTMQLAFLKGLQFQRDYPLERMYNQYKVVIGENYINVKLLINRAFIIPQNKIVSEYYFEAILAYGDINKDSRLQIESTESPLYSFSNNLKTTCTLYLSKPTDTDWMVLLKLNCLEENELAWHSRHYRMAVVAGNPQPLKGGNN